MSDRSYATLTVYRATPEQLADIARVIKGDGEFEIGTWPREEQALADEDGLVLGEQYAEDEVRLGSMAELAEKIHEAHPDVVFIATQEAKYEFPGDVSIATDLGFFQADVDQSGDVTVTAEFVRQAAENVRSLPPEEQLNALVAAIEAATGGVHFAEINRFEKARQEEGKA